MSEQVSTPNGTTTPLPQRDQKQNRRRKEPQNDQKDHNSVEQSTTIPSDTKQASETPTQQKTDEVSQNNGSSHHASTNEPQQYQNRGYRNGFNHYNNNQYAYNNRQYNNQYNNRGNYNNNKPHKPYYKTDAESQQAQQQQPTTQQNPIQQQHQHPQQQPTPKYIAKNPARASKVPVRPEIANERFDNTPELAKIGESENQKIDSAIMSETKRISAILPQKGISPDVLNKIKNVQAVLQGTWEEADILVVLEECRFDEQSTINKLMDEQIKKDELAKKEKQEKEAKRQFEITTGMKVTDNEPRKPRPPMNAWQQKQGRQVVIESEPIIPTVPMETVMNLRRAIESRMNQIRKQQEEMEHMKSELEALTDVKRNDVAYLTEQRTKLTARKEELENSLAKVKHEIEDINRQLDHRQKEQNETLNKLKQKIFQKQ